MRRRRRGLRARAGVGPVEARSGIPVALLGLVAYVVLVAAWSRRAASSPADGRRDHRARRLRLQRLLTQQAVVDIGATCQWCLLSFALMTALAVVAVARMLREAG